MESLPYISGTHPANPGPLARFLPPLEEGTVAEWLGKHVTPGAWLLDPFGFSPRLVLEAARAGYRVLVTANNPITRFLMEMAASAPGEAGLKSALAELAASRKGDERLETHLQNSYLTPCEKCGKEIQAQAFLWRKNEETPYARIYECPNCTDKGERTITPVDIERAQSIAKSASLHRACSSALRQLMTRTASTRRKPCKPICRARSTRLQRWSTASTDSIRPRNAND